MQVENGDAALYLAEQNCQVLPSMIADEMIVPRIKTKDDRKWRLLQIFS